MSKSNLIDIELIKKYVDITEEELMMRLVKDAVGLQKEAEENKHRSEVQERLADPEYRKYVIMFWKEYDYLKQYFTDDEIIEAAAEFMPKSFLVTDHPFLNVMDIPSLQKCVVAGKEKFKKKRLFIPWLMITRFIVLIP